METAIDYLVKKHNWKVSSDPRTYLDYPDNYGLRNYTENGINYDADCNGYHRAFDLYNNSTDDIPSVTHGTVLEAQDRGNFGGTVILKDYNGYIWVYGHVQRGKIKVKKGQKVRQGDILALQGSSNYYDNPMAKHLHLQLLAPKSEYKKGKWYCKGLQIDRYNINNGDYKPVKPKQRDLPKLNIRKNLSHNTNYFNGKSPVKYITVHDTGNPSAGANADAHANFINNGSTETWHYTVDDRGAIQHFYDTTRCWHAGDGRGHGNMSSIGIEMCINSDGNFRKTVENTAKLVRILMDKYNIPIENVVQHNYWSGKNCPASLRSGKHGLTWKRFINMVLSNKTTQVKASSKKFNNRNNKTKPVNNVWNINKDGIYWKKERATFTCTADVGIITRIKGPFTGWPQAGTLLKGQSVNYDEVQLFDGHVWISWTTYEGIRVYMPVRTWNGVAPGAKNYSVGPLWGIIK